MDDDNKVVRLFPNRPQLQLDLQSPPNLGIELDMRKVGEVHCFPSVTGRGDNPELHIIIHDVTTGVVRPFGVLRMTAEQWQFLKEMGDQVLVPHLARLLGESK